VSKITLKRKKDGTILITNKLVYPEAINERIHREIVSGKIDGILPSTVSKKRNETKICCEVCGLTPLTEYFSEEVSGETFLNIVNQVVQLIKKCDENMLNVNNLDLQYDRIFVDVRTKRVYCVFWPVVNNKNENSAQLFFKKLVTEFEDNIQLKAGWLERYNLFFADLAPFSVNSFERLIEKMQGTKGNGNSSGGRYNRLGSSQNQPERQNVSPNSRDDVEYDPVKECDRTISVKKDRIVFEKIVLGEDYNISRVIKLIRISNNEIREIKKDIFKIGTDKDNDLVISDNKYISRQHADIVSRKGHYYLIDRGSTNRSFVNGVVIPVGKETEIFSGYKIRLANEELVFCIE